MRKKLVWAGILLAAILLIGTFGYWLLEGRDKSLLDCLYMTVITIATVGYGEIVGSDPSGRIFTMVLIILGIGVLAYIVTNFTALIVEGEMTKSFRRQRMEKIAGNSREHYIVCGISTLGWHIVKELRTTRRPYVLVDCNKDSIEAILAKAPDEVCVEGDATDGGTLLKAGILQARGLIALTGDDNQNLVIVLTAKQLNPRMRIVTRCNDPKNVEKMKKAGADAVVSPTLIGGLRMASEMIRPTVVSFLDTMLRDANNNLRVEEVGIPTQFAGKKLTDLNLKRFPHLLLLAVKMKDAWVYNPQESYIIRTDDTLVFMATPEERHELEQIFSHKGE